MTTPTASPASGQQPATFGAYFEQFLLEHAEPITRRYHFIGTGLAILCLAHFGCTGRLWLLPLIPVFYYGFSIYGHRVVNAKDHGTFRRPFYNILADLRMFWHVLEHRISLH